MQRSLYSGREAKVLNVVVFNQKSVAHCRQ
jgi:hypothetical protein